MVTSVLSFVLLVIFLSQGIAGCAQWVLTGFPISWFVAAPAGIGWVIVQRKERKNGRSRKTDSDSGSAGASDDPGLAGGGTYHTHYAHVSLPKPFTFSGSFTTGAAPGVEETPDLEVVEGDSSIRAWKRARVLWNSGRPSFQGVGAHYGYGVDDEAKCRADRYGLRVQFLGQTIGEEYPLAHAAPRLDCGCGFWAYRSADAPVEYPNAAYLDVELYGRIIEFEKGYRAQHQRVMRVTFDNWCYDCGQPAKGLRVDNEAGALCPTCADGGCPPHSVITLPVLRERLGGVEVAWA